MKRMGRRHRPFYRICAMDARTPRDGKAIEELGYYDPMIKETDARAMLKGDRIDYWLGVGAQPSEKVKVLIKKYGSSGTHLQQQRVALERLKIKATAPPPTPVPLSAKKGPEAETAQAETEDAGSEAVTEGQPAAES
jgi:small subunit ribosomal protein S16